MEASVSEEPLLPPTFGEMRFARVPDTATSGAIAGALLTSWKCKTLPQSGVPSLSLRLLTSWLSSCSSGSGHLRSSLCHSPNDRERIQRTAGKICLEEADTTEPDSPEGRKFTLRILDTSLIQVNWLPARCPRRVSVQIKRGEGCVPDTDRGAREADRGGKAWRVIVCV